MEGQRHKWTGQNLDKTRLRDIRADFNVSFFYPSCVWNLCCTVCFMDFDYCIILIIYSYFLTIFVSSVRQILRQEQKLDQAYN
jgi:hypothetical protein